MRRLHPPRLLSFLWLAVLLPFDVGAQTLNVASIQRLPPATAVLVLRSARAADPVAYDRFRDTELEKLGVAEDSVRALVERFGASYDSARMAIRGGRLDLEVPALKPLLSGSPHVLLEIRERFSQRVENPLNDVVNELVAATLDTAASRLLRPLSAAEVERFAELQLERDGGGPLQGIAEAQAFLTETARSASEWQALSIEHQRRTLRALQARAADARARGEAAIAQFQQRAGAEADAGAARVFAAIDRTRQVIDLSDRLRALEVDAFRAVVQERDRFEAAIGEFRQRVGGQIRTVSDLRERTALAALIADEIGSDALREVARRVDGAAVGVEAFQDLAASLNDSRRGMLAATHAYATQARTIFVGFATAFGVSPEKQQRVVRTLETIAQVTSVGANIAAGNYAAAAMQAIPLVASFFGKKSPPGPDVHQLRYEALQAQLGVINQKLDSIASWQLQTIAKLDSLRHTVDSLGFALAAQHVQLLDELDGLKRAVFYQIGLSDDNDRQALARCDALRYFWGGDYAWETRIEDYSVGPVFASIRRCFEVLSDYSPDPDISGLNNLRMLYVDVENTENMRLDQGVPSAIRRIRQYYQKWLRDPERGTGIPSQRERLVAALAAPTLTFTELNTKYSRARSGVLPVNVRLDPITFENPLAESVVLELVRRLLEVHSLYPLQKTDGSLREIHEMSSMPLTNAGSEFAEARLRSALYMLDAAIAYQTLLGGDLLLPALAEDVYRPKYVEHADSTVRKMLSQNATLASNVVRHVLYQAAANRCSVPQSGQCVTPGMYADLLKAAPVPGQVPGLIALTSRSVGGQEKNLGDVIVHENGAWRIMFGSQPLELPSPDEFARGAYEPTPGLVRLWAARDAVVDALAGYEMFRRISDRRSYAAVLLYQ